MRGIECSENASANRYQTDERRIAQNSLRSGNNKEMKMTSRMNRQKTEFPHIMYLGGEPRQ
jgi:hypothetical protein